MLKELHIRNYAIIDELRLSLGPGLNVLTGETGAGKSILVGALGVALGQRAYTEMIKTGHDEAAVEAFFDLPRHPLLEELGVESAEGIIIRRNISSAGKTKAYINDSMVNVQTLAQLGRTLVDIHGQHDHQSLLSPEKQLLLLDSYGHLEGQRERVRELFEDVQALRRKIEGLRQSARERAQRLDLLRFQINEIEAAAPLPGEDDELDNERQVLSNLGRLNELIETAHGLLYGEEGSCLERLSSADSCIKEMASIDQGVASIKEALEQAIPLVEDASFSLRDLRDRYDMDPGRLSQVEDRLDLLNNLKRKYGDSVEAVLGHKEDAEREVQGIENSDETAEALARELEGMEAELAKAASELSARRRETAAGLEGAVKGVLQGLALEKSEFAASMTEAPVSASGMDSMEFLFSANRGEPPKPLGKVASGGELSRIMLAVKSVMSSVDDIPVLIFDEVDAGIGGRTAQNVAAKLKELSGSHQVICITHLPQIASQADRHYLIEKAPKNRKVSVTVREISGEQRREEIARMLSGTVTDTSLEHAREIMEKTG